MKKRNHTFIQCDRSMRYVQHNKAAKNGVQFARPFIHVLLPAFQCFVQNALTQVAFAIKEKYHSSLAVESISMHPWWAGYHRTDHKAILYNISFFLFGFNVVYSSLS